MKVSIKPLQVTEYLNLYIDKKCGDKVYGTAVLTKNNEKVYKFFEISLRPTKKYIPIIKYFSDTPKNEKDTCSYSYDFNEILQVVMNGASRFLTTTFDTFNLGKEDIEHLHRSFKKYRNLLRVYFQSEEFNLWEGSGYKIRNIPRSYKMEFLKDNVLLFWLPKVERNLSIIPPFALDEKRLLYKLVGNHFLTVVVEENDILKMGFYWRWNSDFQVKFFENNEPKVIFHSDKLRRLDIFPISNQLVDLYVEEKNGVRFLCLNRKKLSSDVQKKIDSLAPECLRVESGKYIFIPNDWTAENYRFAKGGAKE